MLGFKQYNLYERMLLASSFLMLVIFVLRDQFISPAIMIFFLTTIPFWKGKRYTKYDLIAWIFIAFYILHIISLFYSDNWNYAGDDLMTKLSYLVFPAFVLLVRNGYEIIIKGFKWGLIIGVSISMSVSLIRALFIEGSLNGEAFHPANYALNMHSSYLSLLFIISCAFFWWEKLPGKLMLVVRVIYTGLVILSLFYLRSLGAFVCIAAVLFAIPIWNTVKTRNYKWLLLLPLYGLIFWGGIKSSASIENDVRTSLSKLYTWNQDIDQYLLDNKNDMESNTVRLVTWTLSGRVVKANPFGVGIGDVKDELEVMYRSRGFTYYAYYELNPHNQFLQTGVAIGWIGIFLLLFIFLAMLYRAFGIGNLALFLGILCVFVSCFFESMLERQVGVILTSMLMMILVFYARLNANEVTEESQ